MTKKVSAVDAILVGITVLVLILFVYGVLDHSIGVREAVLSVYASLASMALVYALNIFSD